MGKKIAELTMMRLICIVMAIIFTVPVFTLSTYTASNTFNSAAQSGLFLININYNSNPNGPLYIKTLNSYTAFMSSSAVRQNLINVFKINNGITTSIFQSTTVQVS